jgi:uncharacterized protein (DUF697 family)
MANRLNGAVRVWDIVRGFSASDIRARMEMPLRIEIAGSDENVRKLLERLGIGDRENLPADEAAQSPITLAANALATLPDKHFTTALGHLAREQGDRRIALAARVPGFRPVVVAQLSRERAFNNGKMAALSALPGVVPFTDWLLPATAMGDLIVLTRSQLGLLLEVAACYNQPPEPRERIRELLPVVGSAFGWRALARELVGLVPGGVGVVIKATVAYAGTYAVGRAAGLYYARGRQPVSAAQVKAFYREAMQDALRRTRAFVTRRKPDNP